MTPMQQTELPLRDIHLPEPSSWWPLAPGWWALFVLLLLLVGLIFYLYRRYQAKLHHPLHLAQVELDKIKQKYELQADQQTLLKDLSALLRRTCLSLDNNEQIAALTGKDWLQYLDQHLPDRPFSTGPGQVLLYGPYQKTMDFEADSLFEICQQWLTQLGRVHKQ